jgi:DNA-binding transcriptional MerR regulator
METMKGKNIFGLEEPFFPSDNLIQTEETKDIYSIKDIENITGVKAHTLRIWEQRYNFLTTKRTPTNIRYFDDADLRKLLNITLLNANGYKISRIASMSDNEIKDKCHAITLHNHAENKEIQSLVDAMMAFDEFEFNKCISNSILKKGIVKTMVDLVFPFLEKCGVLWIVGEIQPAHEHFASNLIRQKLHVGIDNVGGNYLPHAKKFLLFVPTGESHDIGLLFANFMLRAKGHKVIYLGTSLPFEDLSTIFSFHKPDFIFSIITALNSKIKIQHFVDTLSEKFPNTQLLLSGNQIISKKDLIVPSNVKILYNPFDFEALIEEQSKP